MAKLHKRSALLIIYSAGIYVFKFLPYFCPRLGLFSTHLNKYQRNCCGTFVIYILFVNCVDVPLRWLLYSSRCFTRPNNAPSRISFFHFARIAKLCDVEVFANAGVDLWPDIGGFSLTFFVLSTPLTSSN